ASGNGIAGGTLSADLRDLALASDGNRVAVAWSEMVSGVRQIYLRELSGGAWNALSGSASGSGVSGIADPDLAGSISHNAMPSLSYFNGQLFAAWQTHSDQGAAVAVATFANTPARTLALVDTIAAPELPASPSLSAGGDALRLLWVRQPLENQPTDLYAMRYNGSHFVAELPGEASPGGFSRSGGIATQLVAATDATGRTSVAWLDAISGQPEIHARGMSATVSRTFYANSVTGIQAILDGNDLAAGDFIVVNGSVNGDVTIAAGDAGVAIVGAPGSRIVGSVTVAAGANNVLLQGLDISGTVTVQGANGFTLTESKAGAVTLQGGANAQITANQLSGNLTLQGAVNAALIDSNRINAATGLDLQAGAAVSNLTVSRNNFQGTNGIALNAAASGRIRDNSISASATGLNIAAAFSGLIDGNRIANAASACATMPQRHWPATPSATTRSAFGPRWPATVPVWVSWPVPASTTWSATRPAFRPWPPNSSNSTCAAATSA
uniref:NosD domain-containing protein n=1 Tax=Methylomonas koyamae TaxID=702114 RepID=UPI000A6D89EE